MGIRILFYLTALSSLGVALVSYRFLFLPLPVAFPGMVGHIDAVATAFWLHITASPVALALGAFQFLPGLRARRPQVHRWTGRVYAAAIAVGGLSALVLAANSLDRPVAASGFALLAVFWLGITGIAVRHAMARNIAVHREWMIRSFALTLAGVTLRLQLPFFFGVAGLGYPETSNWVAWICWVPNLLIAEWYLRQRPRAKAAPAASSA